MKPDDPGVPEESIAGDPAIRSTGPVKLLTPEESIQLLPLRGFDIRDSCLSDVHECTAWSYPGEEFARRAAEPSIAVNQHGWLAEH
jgi:hypothetical protein